jgi:cytochrome b pre-mRNA-processing protein 3
MQLLRRLFGTTEADPRESLRPLYNQLVAHARQPHWYLDGGIPDSVNGRFEMVATMFALVLLRLEQESDSGREMALLTEIFVADMDAQLREIGVGDLTVPKKIKKMAQGWLGRGVAYREGLDQPDDAMLALGLARNVYGDETRAGEPQILRLARYARSLDAAFDGMDVPTLLRDGVPRVEAESV